MRAKPAEVEHARRKCEHARGQERPGPSQPAAEQEWQGHQDSTRDGVEQPRREVGVAQDEEYNGPCLELEGTVHHRVVPIARELGKPPREVRVEALVVMKGAGSPGPQTLIVAAVAMSSTYAAISHQSTSRPDAALRHHRSVRSGPSVGESGCATGLVSEIEAGSVITPVLCHFERSREI